jgi:hypothetical protein
VALAPRSELLALLAVQVLGIGEVGASLRDRLLVGGAYGHLMCGRWRILRQSGTGSDCERKNNAVVIVDFGIIGFLPRSE